MSCEEVFDSNLAHALVCARSFASPELPLPEAEQCARLALLKAATFIEKNTVENVKAYVTTCVKNEIISLLRQNARWEDSRLDEEELAAFSDHGPSPDREANRNDIRKLLDAALANLTPAQRLVMERIRDGSRQVDIAYELGVSPTAIRSLQRRASESMASELNQNQIAGPQFMPDSDYSKNDTLDPFRFDAEKRKPRARISSGVVVFAVSAFWGVVLLLIFILWIINPR